jgi:5-methylcytosine-specific restriction endonuclease McrA
MDHDYGSGSLATMLIDLLTSEPYQPDPVEKVNYQDYIQSPEWKLRARLARERAHYHCQLCATRGNDHTLQVHHNNYERLGNELDSDLIVLCDDCHSKHHDKVPKWTQSTSFYPSTI